LIRKALLGIAIPLVFSSCVVRTMMSGNRLTGTCAGACAHYVQCKPGHSEEDRMRCTAECPQVFADRDSLMAFESMSCRNTVEFVDGTSSPSAAR
jgi:hypothetical protein